MKKLTDLFWMSSGFLGGQGLLFLAHTFLIVNEEVLLLSKIGITLGLLNLFQVISDCGGVFFLNNYNKNIGIINFFIARILFSFLFFLVACAFVFFLDFKEYYWVLFIGLFCSLIWSFNITGVIDQKKLNKYCGPFSGLNWGLPAIVIFFNKNESILEYSVFFYCLGLLFIILIQYGVLYWHKYDIGLSFRDIRFQHIIKSFMSILFYSVSYVITQAYARILPIVVDKLLGQQVSGFFIYYKNVSNFVSQLVFFSRRIDYSELVKITLNSSQSVTLFTYIKRQYLGFVLIIVTLTLIGIFSSVLSYFNKYEFLSQALLGSMLFVITLIFWNISSAIGQVFIAQDLSNKYSLVISITGVLSMIFIVWMLESYGVFFICLVESLMYLIQILWFYKIWQSKKAI